jgi:phage gpG-like protein
MSATITIQLSPSAIALADRFRAAPQEFPRAIKRGMNKALLIVAGRIQEKRLTGAGPYPVAEHRLGERTGQLKLRTRSTQAVSETAGDTVTVTGAIGSSVKYAAAHEFGSTKAHVPERAPFRTGIRENAGYISETIEAELMKSLES